MANILNSVFPPCVKYSGKSMSNHAADNGSKRKYDGSTHIKLAYYLYRYFDGSFESASEFEKIYLNWCANNKAYSDFQFSGNANTSISTRCDKLRNEYNKKRKEKSSNDISNVSCVRHIRNMHGVKHLCTLCPLSPEYLNDRLATEIKVLGYALLHQDTSFLNIAEFLGCGYEHIYYENLVLHFTGSYPLLKDGGDVSGTYNFNGLVAYFILRHHKEFDAEKPSQFIQELLTRIDSGSNAVCDFLLGKLYKEMETLSVGGDGIRKDLSTDYSIKDFNAMDFRGCFYSALNNILLAGYAATEEEYKSNTEELRNIYTYNDFWKGNVNVGANTTYIERISNVANGTMTHRRKKKNNKITSTNSTLIEQTLMPTMSNTERAKLIDEMLSANAANVGQDPAGENSTNSIKVIEPVTSKETVEDETSHPVLLKSLAEIHSYVSVAEPTSYHINDDESDIAEVTYEPSLENETEILTEPAPLVFDPEVFNVEEYTNESCIEPLEGKIEDIIETDENTATSKEENNDTDNSVTINFNLSDILSTTKEEILAEQRQKEIADEQVDDIDATIENIDDIIEQSEITDTEFIDGPDIDTIDIEDASQNIIIEENVDLGISADVDTGGTEPEQPKDEFITLTVSELPHHALEDFEFSKEINMLYGLDDTKGPVVSAQCVADLSGEQPIAIEYCWLAELDTYGILIYLPNLDKYWFISPGCHNFDSICWHLCTSNREKICMNYSAILNMLTITHNRWRNIISLPALHNTLNSTSNDRVTVNSIIGKISSMENVAKQIMPLYCSVFADYDKRYFSKETVLENTYRKLLKFEEIVSYSYDLTDICDCTTPAIKMESPGTFEFSYKDKEQLKNNTDKAVICLDCETRFFQYGFSAKEFFNDVLLELLSLSIFSRYKIRVMNYTEHSISIVCPIDNTYSVNDIIIDTAKKTYQHFNKDVVPVFNMSVI